MQGMLNISSLALLAGAVGLGWFYYRFPLHMPHWFVLFVLFLPWLIVFTISFCKAAPFGPRAYRRTLVGVMCGYLSLAVGAEIGQQIWRLPSHGCITLTAARCLMFFGCLSFIPFMLAIRSIRKVEKEGSPNQASDATSEPAPGADSSAHQG